VPISLQWYVDQQVIYETVEGDITLEETGMVTGDLTEMLSTSKQPQIHILIDVQKMGESPDNARLLSTTISPLFLQRNLGWVLIFSDDDTNADFMNAAVTRVFQLRLEVFKNRNDALRFLKNNDPDLSGLAIPDDEDDDWSDEETLPHLR
jgi:hypothetical protein